MIKWDHLRSILAVLGLCLLGAPEIYAQDWDTPLDLDSDEPCKLSLHVPGDVEWRGPRSRGYEPEAAALHGERIVLDVRNLGGSCAYELQIAPVGGAARMIGRLGALNYRLKTEGGASEDAADQLTVSEQFHSAGGVASIGFVVEMMTAQYVPAGQYASDVEITLVTLQSGIMHVADTKRLRVSTNVWPRIYASVGERADGGISSHQINLGRLKTGLERELDFSVYANSAYRISIESENQLRLKHDKAPVYVPYGLVLDGVPVDLDHLVEEHTISKGSIGRLHDFRLTVGRVEAGHPAGQYADRLMVTISADQ